MKQGKLRLKKALLFLLNPRLILCFGVAWMITNGWCYIALLLGALLHIDWLTAIATVYAGLLWFPFTPEKIITVIISIFLLRLLFPNDEKTLKVLRDWLASLKQKRNERKSAKEKQKKDSAE